MFYCEPTPWHCQQKGMGHKGKSMMRTLYSMIKGACQAEVTSN